MIKVYNDQKSKWQSFRARYDDFEGYGGSEEEAIKDLKKQINAKIDELMGVDYNNIQQVDYRGNPL